MNYLEKAYQKVSPIHQVIPIHQASPEGLKARESPGNLGSVVKGIGALLALLDMLFSKEKGPREKGQRTAVRRKKRR